MAESDFVESPKKEQKPHRVGYLKMRVVEDLTKETINEHVEKLASQEKEKQDLVNYRLEKANETLAEVPVQFENLIIQ